MAHPVRADSVVCVVVTHDRPRYLRACLSAISPQRLGPGTIIVIDNASGPETAGVIADIPQAVHIRPEVNAGGAALTQGGELIRLMDDDGRPESPDCLARLLESASSGHDLVAPLVLDEDQPARLAFPVCLSGRTMFDAAIRIVLDPGARFPHPGSWRKIYPVLLGLFYAAMRTSPAKQDYLFRNRAFIFRRHRMWMFLAMDVVRYASFFLLNRRGDIPGFARWMKLTTAGLEGRFMHSDQGKETCRTTPTTS